MITLFKWFADVENSSRLEFYSICKFEFGFEKYLSKLSAKNRINLSKFRCSNMKFPIETGRWQNIARNDGICTFCRDNIWDELHYLFICKHELIADLKSKFILKYYTLNPNIHKMNGLLSLCNVPLLKNISLFISKLVDFFLNYVFLVLVEIFLSLIVSVPIYIYILQAGYSDTWNRVEH